MTASTSMLRLSEGNVLPKNFEIFFVSRIWLNLEFFQYFSLFLIVDCNNLSCSHVCFGRPLNRFFLENGPKLHYTTKQQILLNFFLFFFISYFLDRKTNKFENGRWKAGAQGLYAEYGNRVLLKHLSLNAGTF